MAFANKVPEWKAAGTEPPESLKTSGFQAKYKPPAAYFNWFWHGMSEAVKELQETSINAMIGTVNGSAYTFDSALKQGEYNVQAADAAGAPYAGTLYGKLIVTLSDGKEKNDANWIWQEFLPASTSKQRCWRMKINTGDWTNWFVCYDTGHKPSLSELGAAAENHRHPYAINIGYDRTDISSGADLNDILSMGCYRCTTASKAATLLNCPTKNAFILDMVAATGGNIVIDPNGYAYGAQRIYDLDGKQYTRQVTSNANGKITYSNWIKIYSSVEKPAPADIGALNKAGDTMDGDLTLGTSRLFFGDQDNRRCEIVDSGDGLVFGLPGVNFYINELDDAVDALAVRIDNSGTFAVFHAGNKPFGSYTGNGSEANRTISIPAIGEVLTITSDVGFALVSSRGAICLDRQTGQVSGLQSWLAYYKSGKFTIATTNDFVNKSGQAYYYQVL